MRLQLVLTTPIVLLALPVFDTSAKTRRRRALLTLSSATEIAEKQLSALVRFPENTREENGKREAYLKAERVPQKECSYAQCVAGAKRHARERIEVSWRSRWAAAPKLRFVDNPSWLKKYCADEARLIERVRMTKIPISHVLPTLTPQQKQLWQQTYDAAAKEAKNAGSPTFLRLIGRLVLTPHDESMYAKAFRLANGISNQKALKQSMRLLFAAPFFDVNSVIKRNPDLVRIYPDLYVLNAAKTPVKSAREFVSLLRAAPNRRALHDALDAMSDDLVEKAFVPKVVTDESLGWAWRLPLAQRIIQCLGHSDFVSKTLSLPPGKSDALRLAFLDATAKPGICIVQLKDVLRIAQREEEDPEARAAAAVDLARRLGVLRSDLASLEEDEQQKMRRIELVVNNLKKLASTDEAFRLAWETRKSKSVPPTEDTQESPRELCENPRYVMARKALSRGNLKKDIKEIYEVSVRETDRQLLRLLLTKGYESLVASKPQSLPEQMKKAVTFAGKPCLYLPSNWGKKGAAILVAPVTMLDEEGKKPILYVVNAQGIVNAMNPPDVQTAYLQTPEGRQAPELIEQVTARKYSIGAAPPVTP